MKEYTVTIPLAGHATVIVQAENEKEAKEKAFQSDISNNDITWELLNQFSKGNVCYCPSPWSVDVETDGEEIEE